MSRSAVAIAGAVLLGVSAPALAVVSTSLDHFEIARNGVTIFSDAFLDGVPPPSAPAFVNGAAASYNVSGGFAGESGGKLGLSSALGSASTLPDGTPSQRTRADLATNTTPGDPRGLKSDDLFAVTALFDLVAPPAIGDHYGVRLSDVAPTNLASDLVLFGPRRDADGVVRLVLEEQDYVAAESRRFSAVDLDLGLGADQIVLRLERNDIGDNLVTASFMYLAGGNPLTNFITLGGDRPAIFEGEAFTRGGFFVAQAIPEPGTWALLGAGLLAVAAVARRRTRSISPAIARRGGRAGSRRDRD